MDYYLVQNLLGFETPVETGDFEDLERMKAQYEEQPAIGEVGSGKNRFEVEATYYIVPKKEWDIHNCPLIPVDFS